MDYLFLCQQRQYLLPIFAIVKAQLYAESRPKSVTIIEDAIGDKASQQSQKLYGALRKSVAEYDTTPLVQFLEKDMHLDISHTHTRFTNDIRI